ncbi:MAG TPA: SirB2 family protein [Xanthomonadaceae bacterium]|nr:SirB2 family protein [Xanthomonadaceae bacterium]
MIAWYLQIKWIHIATVLASGGLFFARGTLVLAGAPRPAMWAPVRYLSYANDTALLTTALMLATMLHQYPFVHGWLTAKVLLLVAYIVLGTYALRRAPTRGRKAVCFAAALAIYALIISIARAHHPLGFLAGLPS